MELTEHSYTAQVNRLNSFRNKHRDSIFMEMPDTFRWKEPRFFNHIVISNFRQSRPFSSTLTASPHCDLQTRHNLYIDGFRWVESLYFSDSIESTAK